MTGERGGNTPQPSIFDLESNIGESSSHHPNPYEVIVMSMNRCSRTQAKSVTHTSAHKQKALRTQAATHKDDILDLYSLLFTQGNTQEDTHEHYTVGTRHA